MTFLSIAFSISPFLILCLFFCFKRIRRLEDNMYNLNVMNQRMKKEIEELKLQIRTEKKTEMQKAVSEDTETEMQIPTQDAKA